MMLLPGAAAKFQAQEERDAGMVLSAGEVRKRALDALEGKRSPAMVSNGWGGAVQEAEKIVMPDLSDDNAVVETEGEYLYVPCICFKS